MQNIVLQHCGQAGDGQVRGGGAHFGKQTVIDDLMQQRMPQPAGRAAAEDQHWQRRRGMFKKHSGLLQGGEQPGRGFRQKNDKAANARVAGKRLRIRRQHNGPHAAGHHHFD